MTKTKRILLTTLALIGLALSIELCVVYYNANFALEAKPSICVINEVIDCDVVAKTSYSQFFGIPLALWGVLLYLFFLFMTYVDKIQNIKFLGFLKVFKNPTSYIFTIGLLSFCISMILGFISIFKINSVCIFCFMTYAVDLLIALTSKNWGSGAFYEIKNSISDFIEAIKVKRYAFWFILLVLLACSILFYTGVSNILSPQIAKQSELKQYFNSYKSMANGMELGPKDANVIVHEVFDFNCQGCFLANLYAHRIITEFENVKFVHHNLPIQKDCNHNMVTQGHKNSCLKAKYALAANKQNRYWEMVDILFLENIQDEEDIIQQAKIYKFDVKKLQQDAHSAEVAEELEKSVEYADSKGITGTPTLIIGMQTHMGASIYPEFKQMIIDAGGREKQNHG